MGTLLFSERSKSVAEARALHRAGSIAEARAIYEALLQVTPEDPEALGLLAVVELQTGQARRAEEMLRRALSAGGPVPVRLRNLNNLLALLQREGDARASRELITAGLPDWHVGVAPDASERETILSLGSAFLLLGEASAAKRLLDDAFPEPGDDAAVLSLLGCVLLTLGMNDAAVGPLARAVELEPDDGAALMALGEVQGRLSQNSDARATSQRFARRWPVHSAPSRARQGADLLVLNPLPESLANFAFGVGAGHFQANFTSQLAGAMAGDFRFHSVLAELPAAALPTMLPRADAVVNNLVDPETMNLPGRMDPILELVARIGAPVINHPRAVHEMTRQKTAVLLQGIPNLVVPRIARYQPGEVSLDRIVDDIAQQFGFPVIIRRCRAHSSSAKQHSPRDRVAALPGNRAELREELAAFAWPEFYAVEYLPLQRKDGHFRKIRAVAAPDEVIVAIPGFAGTWMVAGGRRRANAVAYYRANPETTEESRQIVRDPEGMLGRSALVTLEAIRDRLPLDFYGIDFEVDDAGRVVFFEANAAMNLLKGMNEPADISMPDEPFERVKEAFRRLVDQRVAEAAR